MNPERWQQIEKIFQAAVEMNPAERPAFLDNHCSEDEEIRRNVEALLASDEQGCELLETPAFEAAASLLVEAPPQLAAGQTLGHYRIESLLGMGGMGEVYLAEDAKLRRKAALKLLPLFFSTDNKRVQQFEQEALAASALNHPNIITIYEIDEFDNRPFLATEFIDGETLRQRTGRGKLELGEILDIAIQVASALESSHRAGIIHRDIKPENIMLRRDGYVKVLDFGLAKLTELQEDSDKPEVSSLPSIVTTSSLLMGTVSYMSPEQANRQVTDARSDIFSLGVVMYEMVAGHPPFQGESSDEILASISHTEPQALHEFQPDLPNEAQRIIAKSLAKDKNARYQSTKELLIDLKELRKEVELVSNDLAPVTSAVNTVAIQTKAKKEAESNLGTFAPNRKSAKFAIFGSLPKVKKWHIALVVFIILGLSIPSTLWLHKYYSQSDTAQLSFQERDWILITAFENQTGESVFDGTLEYAVERELNNSGFINVVSRARVEDALRLMRQPPDKELDAALGKEVCLRDSGIRAMLTGWIKKLATGYTLSVSLLDPASGLIVASSKAEGRDEKQLENAVRQLSNWTRQTLGEKLGSIRQSSEAMEKVTTPSLKALQLYTQADTLMRQEKWAVAEQLFRQAIAGDPEFASAHIMLAWTLFNQKKPDDEWRPPAERALELSKHVSEREQYFIQGSYYSIQRQDDTAVPFYEALLQRYPDHYWGRNNLVNAYGRLRRLPELLSQRIFLANERPNDFFTQGMVASTANAAGQTDISLQYVKRAKELITPEAAGQYPYMAAWIQFYFLKETFIQGDLETTLAEANRIAETVEARTGEERDAFAHHTCLEYLRLGKLKLAVEIARTIGPEDSRYFDLILISLEKNDKNSLRTNLSKWNKIQDRMAIPEDILFLLQAGLFRKAEKQIADATYATWKKEGFLKVFQGQLALAYGRIEQAIPLLLQGLDSLKTTTKAFSCEAWESLSVAYERQRDVNATLHALEDGSRENAYDFPARTFLLRIKAKLAQFYRKLGRVEQAQKVEEELLSQLKYADADHPILLQIQQARKQ